MPRTGRFVTEFSIPSDPSKVWIAEFTHKHATSEKPLTFAIDGKDIPVQHLTSVKLRYRTKDGHPSPVFLSGHAPCSVRDVYRWQHGLHLALRRALEKGGFCKLSKVNGKIVVTEKKPQYDEVMDAFWLEMKIKAPVSTAPPETASGTYHLGAD